LLFSVFADLKRKPLLGTAVTDPHRYHPATLAQMAMTVDHISGGRFILGIGAGEAFNLESYGFDYKKKPVSKMVEFIEVLRKLWASGGEKVSHSGEFFELREAILEPSPIQNPIPIWMAANGPRTRELAGAIADGWLPIPFSAETYKMGLEEVKASLKRNNWSVEDFTFGYWN
ncbi:MAG: LLM class flavin-dependent oxidoreductase, partial [Candidatus Freyarchaeota archaeon]